MLLAFPACHGRNEDSTGDDEREAGSEVDARGEDDLADADSGAGASTDSGMSAGADSGAGTGAIKLPPANAGLDYQLGGSYAPAANVGIVSRDRTEKPAPGLYNICYINGFQAQPDADDFWLIQHPDLVLRDAMNKPVIDKDWNEMLLDVSSADKRERLLQVETEWIAGCASAGFQALEVDNLDTYSRSGGRISQDNAVAFMKLLSAEAHRQGLAIAQKNATDLVGRRAEMGTDFVVSEECAHYDECDDYIRGYGEHVLLIEYTKSDFDKACKSYPSYSVVLRDRNLVRKGQSGYVFDGC
jgi:hypothetical protein